MNRHVDLAPGDTELAITPQPSRASHTLPPGTGTREELGRTHGELVVEAAVGQRRRLLVG